MAQNLQVQILLEHPVTIALHMCFTLATNIYKLDWIGHLLDVVNELSLDLCLIEIQIRGDVVR